MFPYFGNKYAKAKRYPPPAHSTIVEPFAGGAGYGVYWLERTENLQLVVVEQDPIVCDLWRRMLEPGAAAKIRALPDVQVGEYCRDTLPSLTLYRADRLRQSVGPNGFKVLKWMARDWPRIRERTASRAERLANRVTLIEGDYTMAPDVEATWFIDPPYQHQGKNEYSHGAGALDYDKLGTWCQSRAGQTIVCEGEGADWLPFTENHQVQRTTNTRRVSGHSTYSERVWLNPSSQGTLAAMNRYSNILDRLAGSQEGNL